MEDVFEKALTNTPRLLIPSRFYAIIHEFMMEVQRQCSVRMSGVVVAYGGFGYSLGLTSVQVRVCVYVVYVYVVYVYVV